MNWFKQNSTPNSHVLHETKSRPLQELMRQTGSDWESFLCAIDLIVLLLAMM